MEIYSLDRDIPIVCVTAETFPLGILPAHEKLHNLIPYSKKRSYFGISRPGVNGNIIYKAAAEEINAGEAELLKLETMTVKQGKYLSRLIPDFHKDVEQIGKTFRQMITDPRIDPQSFCVEWYINQTDVRCMVRLVE